MCAIGHRGPGCAHTGMPPRTAVCFLLEHCTVIYLPSGSWASCMLATTLESIPVSLAWSPAQQSWPAATLSCTVSAGLTWKQCCSSGRSFLSSLKPWVRGLQLGWGTTSGASLTAALLTSNGTFFELDIIQMHEARQQLKRFCQPSPNPGRAHCLRCRCCAFCMQCKRLLAAWRLTLPLTWRHTAAHWLGGAWSRRPATSKPFAAA